MELEVMLHSKSAIERLASIVNEAEDSQMKLWFNQVNSSMNRSILGLKKDFAIAYKLCIALDNTAEFYQQLMGSTKSKRERKDYARRCATTMFFIAVQLGMEKIDSDFTKFDTFKSIVDLKDFEKVDEETLDCFDYSMMIRTVQQRIGVDDVTVDVFGLNTALILKCK